MTISVTEHAAAPPVLLARVLQLASPALPVGGYSYSQGLEWAVEAGWLGDAGSVRRWLHGLLHGPVGGAEAQWVARLLRAWREPSGDDALLRLDALCQASREGAQLLAETRQMGWSLLRLLEALPPALAGPALVQRRAVLQRLAAQRALSYPLAWTCLAAGFGLDDAEALQVWLWSWLENQVMAALKTVPLGQNAGQVLLLDLARGLAPLAARAVAAASLGPVVSDPTTADDDDGPGNFAPGFALAVTGHETLYSRLFRS